MLKNYLKATLRSLVRYRGFSLINIIGLALSMAVCLIIILFVREETSFDDFHENKDRIYRIVSRVKFQNGAIDDLATSPAPLAPVLRTEYTGIEDVVRLYKVETIAVYKDENLAIRGIAAEASFFNIFDFELLQGEAKEALAEPYGAVISATLAQKFFGGQNPVGLTMYFDQVGDVVITGVMQKARGKTHFEHYFDVVFSFATMEAINARIFYLQDWQKSISRYYTYVLVNEKSNAEYLQAELSRIVDKYYLQAQPGDYSFSLQALRDIRLGPEFSNKIERQTPKILLKILAILAFILTLTSGFNYMNLSVARSLKRAKEVGIRKVAGALRRQIIIQFLGEAVIVSWIALVLALILLEVWLLPAVNRMWLIRVYLEADISTQLFANYPMILTFFALATTIGLLAGLYPALVFSSYLPSIVLKGVSTIKGYFGMTLRKTLVVIQFALSIVFIITTLVVYRQAEHILAADYGFDDDQILNLALQGNAYEVVRNELLSHPNIQDVSAVSLIPGTGDWETTRLQTSVLPEPVRVAYFNIDVRFLDNLSIPLIAGRDFSKRFASDRGASVILNEKALESLQLGAPQQAVGKTVTKSEGGSFTVVGVVKNFYNTDLGRIDPLAFFFNENAVNFANIKINPGGILGTIAFIEKTWKKLDPIHPIAHRFYKQQLTDNFTELDDYLTLIGTGAGFVVLIACLGLLGMATYNAETRVKEVGIRKVLGATVANVVLLLSKDLLLLIGFAAVLGTPAAWYMGNLLLQNFAYRVNIGADIFVFGIAITLLLAFATIASQSIKASLANPVETLRHE